MSRNSPAEGSLFGLIEMLIPARGLLCTQRNGVLNLSNGLTLTAHLSVAASLFHGLQSDLR